MLRHVAIVLVALTAPAAAQDDDAIMRAMVDELGRSMTLQLEDLEKPYFIRYAVDDTHAWTAVANLGALVAARERRTRTFQADVRVGSYELDSSNFGGRGGGFFGGRRGGGGFARRGARAALPIEDDYLGIRQAIWLVTDQAYKDAVEALTEKRASIEDEGLEERPADYTKAEAVAQIEPRATLRIDKAAWESNLKAISARLKTLAELQDSSVTLTTDATNKYLVTSEGSRLRTARATATLRVTAEAQSDEGVVAGDDLTWTGDTAADLPELAEVLADVDALVKRLRAAVAAPVAEAYLGPVLFDGAAAAEVFRSMLAGGIAGRAETVGRGRRFFRGAESLERKLGQRILPAGFTVYDDPTLERVAGTFAFGHYRFDDEGVGARRVDVVVNGKLKTLLMSRTPTKALSGSNGHGRRGRAGGTVSAAVGTLVVEHANGVSHDDLKKRLIEAARDEGLEFGLRITALGSGGGGFAAPGGFRRGRGGRFRRGFGGGGGGRLLGDPARVYRVHVGDGREEMVRGLEFGDVTVRALRRIIAAGREPHVLNAGGSDSTIAAPPILFEELELAPIDQGRDQRPLLPPPGARHD